MEQQSTVKKVLNFIGNILFAVIIILAAVITIISLSTKDRGVANFAGIMPFSIQSPSMEPTIMTGDLIITKKCDPYELKENDVISFFAIEQDQRIVKTHRIVKVNKTGNMLSFVTKGDNNELEDNLEVADGDVISVYDGIRIPQVGNVLDFLKSQVGFFVCIIIPLFIFFMYQLYNFIMIVVDMKKEKIKEQMRAELMKEQEKANKTTKEPEVVKEDAKEEVKEVKTEAKEEKKVEETAKEVAEGTVEEVAEEPKTEEVLAES